jgi:hypothetical protein
VSEFRGVAFQRKKPAPLDTKAPYPSFIEPALATQVDRVPSGMRWIHEIKFDGYRVQLHIANDLLTGQNGAVVPDRPRDRVKAVGAGAGAAFVLAGFLQNAPAAACG